MALHLYNFTLQNPGTVTHAVAGSFADSESTQILVARGHVLELVRFDGVKSYQIIASTEVFGVIRSMAKFRLHGTLFLFFNLFHRFLTLVAHMLTPFPSPWMPT